MLAGVGGCAEAEPPDVPVLALRLAPIKQLELGWEPVAGAERYELLESLAAGEPLAALDVELEPHAEAISLTVPLSFLAGRSYGLRACNEAGCTDSLPVAVEEAEGSISDAVGYVKAAKPHALDLFGSRVALSTDGSTLVVAADGDANAARGIDPEPRSSGDGIRQDSGAIYVFVRGLDGGWAQQAYIKAASVGEDDRFGRSLALSGDGNTLVVGAPFEDSAQAGIGGDGLDDDAPAAGAVYVFERDAAGRWSQQAYLKGSDTEAGDVFGRSVALSEDGDVLVVGAPGWGNSEADDLAGSGAVYELVRGADGGWSEQARLQASNAEDGDLFGGSVALSADGRTLAVGAEWEDGSASGIDGDQASNDMYDAGAVYVLGRTDDGTWSQQAYVKASAPERNAGFGGSVVLSADGHTLVVGSPGETGPGVNSDGDANIHAGAAYVLVRADAGRWSQQARLETTIPGRFDGFGGALALSADGSVLAVGARGEDAEAAGVGDEPSNDDLEDSGTVYLFTRSEPEWTRHAYVKAPNAGVEDQFGWSVALSVDGSTLVVGAAGEASGAGGVGADPSDDSRDHAGAVYLY